MDNLVLSASAQKVEKLRVNSHIFPAILQTIELRTKQKISIIDINHVVDLEEHPISTWVNVGHTHYYGVEYKDKKKKLHKVMGTLRIYPNDGASFEYAEVNNTDYSSFLESANFVERYYKPNIPDRVLESKMVSI